MSSLPTRTKCGRYILRISKLKGKTLEKELVKYNTTLGERGKLLEENSRIKQQNDELKLLLNQYVTASVSYFNIDLNYHKINEELMLPPVTIA